MLGELAPFPQSLHLLLRRLCSQMSAPPQSSHVIFWRLRSQSPAPPQSLHVPWVLAVRPFFHLFQFSKFL